MGWHLGCGPLKFPWFFPRICLVGDFCFGFYHGINHNFSPLFGIMFLGHVFQASWPCKSKTSDSPWVKKPLLHHTLLPFKGQWILSFWTPPTFTFERGEKVGTFFCSKVWLVSRESYKYTSYNTEEWHRHRIIQEWIVSKERILRILSKQWSSIEDSVGQGIDLKMYPCLT